MESQAPLRALMASKSDLAIHAAVMTCAAHCAESHAPFACVGDFLEKLVEMGWDADDVAAVTQEVLALLDELNRQNVGDSLRNKSATNS